MLVVMMMVVRGSFSGGDGASSYKPQKPQKPNQIPVLQYFDESL